MSTTYTAPALPCVPLVPQTLLKAYNVDCIIDTRFRAAARLLQSLWLKDNNIATGVHIRSTEDGDIVTPLGSLLSREAANAGRNFLSPAIHTFVRHELILRELNSYWDEERLLANALTSQGTQMNVFAPLAMDLELASAVFRHLLPNFVEEVVHIRFETSPGRHQIRYLSCGSAFDAAVDVITSDGEQGTIFLEIKYSEALGDGPAARHRPRFDEASRQVGLFIDPDAASLRSPMLEQLWRLGMLSQLSVNEGVTPRAMFVAIGPRLNNRAQAAFRCFANELLPEEDLDDNRVRFRAITLETVIDAIHQSGAVDLAKKLWARYCDFERVFHLALAEYTQPDLSNGDTTGQITHVSSPTPRAKPFKARNASRGNGNASDAAMIK